MPSSAPPKSAQREPQLVSLLQHARRLFGVVNPLEILTQTCQEALRISAASVAYASHARPGQAASSRLHVRVDGAPSAVDPAALSALFAVRRRLGVHAVHGGPMRIQRSPQTAAIFDALAPGQAVLWACALIHRSQRKTGEIVVATHDAELGAGVGEAMCELANIATAALESAERTVLARLDQDKLRLLAEASDEALWDWNLDTGELWWGGGIHKLLGPGDVEVQTDPAWRFERIHPLDRTRVQGSFERARGAHSESSWREEYRFLRSDGSTAKVEDRGFFLRAADGRAYRVVGTLRDVTALDRLLEREHAARMEAERANRAKDEFLAMLGHELRNPLAPILTAVDLLRLRGLAEIEKERTIIERQARHLVRLVDDLLDVSRVATGKIELQRRRLDVRDVIARCVEMTQPLIEARGHALRLAVSEVALPVSGDPERLAQVLGNLLTNAAKYTPPGGELEISAEAAGGEVRVVVADNGMGIAPELLPRLFELFVQGRQTIERARGGLGLGLSIVRSLTVLHGGSVEAHSDGPGLGSRFTVRLPLSEAGGEELSADAAAPEPGQALQGLRILIVDDNQDAAELLDELLRQVGHTTAMAHDGPAAVERAAEFSPDVVLLDVGLPGMDGYEVARRLRQRPGERLGLIAVTGYGQENDRRQALEASFDAHLVKPVNMHQLMRTIAELGASRLGAAPG